MSHKSLIFLFLYKVGSVNRNISLKLFSDYKHVITPKWTLVLFVGVVVTSILPIIQGLFIGKWSNAKEAVIKDMGKWFPRIL